MYIVHSRTVFQILVSDLSSILFFVVHILWICSALPLPPPVFFLKWFLLINNDKYLTFLVCLKHLFEIWHLLYLCVVMRITVLKPQIQFHDFQLLYLGYFTVCHSLLGWCCASGWVKGCLERPFRSRHDDNGWFTWRSGLQCSIFLLY